MAENQEINALVKILGLQYGKKYETAEDFKTLRYGKVMIMADQVIFCLYLQNCSCFRTRMAATLKGWSSTSSTTAGPPLSITALWNNLLPPSSKPSEEARSCLSSLFPDSKSGKGILLILINTPLNTTKDWVRAPVYFLFTFVV